MQQLWAPWRMAYIENSEPVHGCLFCTKGAENRDEANYIVWRSARCFVMLNLYPYNSGHLMVVPFQHTGDFALIEPETGSEMFEIARLSVRALHEGLRPKGFNLGINQGEIAGAGVADHIHLHVVPRWGGDTNFMPVLADTKVIPEQLSATAAKLRPIFERLGRRA